MCRSDWSMISFENFLKIRVMEPHVSIRSLKAVSGREDVKLSNLNFQMKWSNL